MGHIVFRIEKPGLFFCNSFKTIHGGAIATWLDCLTTIGIYAFDPHQRLMTVSLNMTIDYMTASQVNQPLLIKTVVKRLGKNIAFTECIFSNAQTKKLVAVGSHKKAFI